RNTPSTTDRPRIRPYLREFNGWASAYPQGLSDPTTLRVRENCWATREGALAIRPTPRSVFAGNNWVTTNYNARIVGTFETFFLNDGTKALLFATKESGGNVTFRVAVDNGATYTITTLADAGFAGDANAMNFSSSTTYVRYLQIDNKVFALPDSTNPSDTVRIFYVGAEKKLVAPKTITSPAWTSGHAPTVLLPEASWINSPSKTTIPTAETPTAGTADMPLTGTLIDSDTADNTYNFGYFYTFQNELGETPA